MLFNSYLFIFLFLPLTLLLFHAVRRLMPGTGMLVCLLLASLLFYGYWNPVYLGLLLPSMLGNYLIGQRISEALAHDRGKGWLALGVGLNLGLLGYFKYRNFFLDSLDQLVSLDISLPPLVLPLAISFFTFQQIAYLVDIYQRKVQPAGLIRYMTFVSFFPQLIAGPIVHYQQVSGQFQSARWLRFDAELFGTGAALFSIGLFKKVVLADQLALFANPVFDGAMAGQAITSLAAWLAAFSYSFQLYFDFSGYADMALGLGAMFGIRLPLNFNSPYKARSIVEFWQRWHITLSNFLRDYLYIPLGGNRRGDLRRYQNLLITMLLGGLWHGAGWTFILWGGAHGVLLAVTHAVQGVAKGRRLLPGPLAMVGTFVIVSMVWVLFRAENVAAAQLIYQAMFSLDGVRSELLASFGLLKLDDLIYARPTAVYIWLPVCAAIVWLLPNSQQWLGYSPDGEKAGVMRGALTKGLLAGVLLFVALNRMAGQPATEFLYFNF